MQKVTPALKITDYEKSIYFYIEGLGFQIDWEHRFEPGFPVFMQITRDEFTIYLTEHEGDCQVGGLVHFLVSDVDNLYNELRKKNIVKEPPFEVIDGLRMLSVEDPDGNELRFMNPKEI